MADEYYIPIDFGTWRTKSGQTITCPRHGVQAGGLAVQVTYVSGGSKIRRDYCSMCIIEALDTMLPHPLEVK